MHFTIECLWHFKNRIIDVLIHEEEIGWMVTLLKDIQLNQKQEKNCNIYGFYKSTWLKIIMNHWQFICPPFDFNTLKKSPIFPMSASYSALFWRLLKFCPSAWVSIEGLDMKCVTSNTIWLRKVQILECMSQHWIETWGTANVV